ncbi:hypothetical protein C3F29_25215 [Escherichia coli]|uniref:hypothetical protein n=1 Tax=Escherichia coli TaxID=562 RepID=UPI000CD5AA24|nr:hypothetical protein [Escherichia coli]POL54754.1 hypothetical protein C3F29_25215 [Escherichia coli]
MNISTETREILRNYRAVINARRREMGQKPLTTAQIVDEICDFVANAYFHERRSLNNFHRDRVITFEQIAE